MKRSRNATESQDPQQQMPLWRYVGITLSLLAALFAVAFYAAAVIYARSWWPWGKPEAPDVVRVVRAAIPVTALVGGGVAIAVGLRRQQSTERTVELTRQATLHSSRAQETSAAAYELDQRRAEREEISYLRERFTTAAAQLGDPSDLVRLAGAYAMAALTDEWIRRGDQHEAQVCVDVLCGYVRTPRENGGSESRRQADIGVRQTVVRTITTHLQPDTERGSLPTWSGLDFDFSGALFDGLYSFHGAVFDSGTFNFQGATITGELSFQEATLSGGRLNFWRAELRGGDLVFVDVSVAGGELIFTDAILSAGNVSFLGSQFTDGNVWFWSTVFSGAMVDFHGATFSGGQVAFTESSLSGGEISFDMARFKIGTVTFGKTAVFPGRVSFGGATFDGGVVNFGSAVFAATVPGPWGFVPPTRWPMLPLLTQADLHRSEQRCH